MCLPIKPFKIEREWSHVGLSCAVTQNNEFGFRCGYVRVPVTHKLWKTSYMDVEGIDVHGGLTFGEIEQCTDHEDGQGYWLGFDCAHSGDSYCDPSAGNRTENTRDMALSLYNVLLSLGKNSILGNHYWTQKEVEAETERLAEQLAEIA